MAAPSVSFYPCQAILSCYAHKGSFFFFFLRDSILIMYISSLALKFTIFTYSLVFSFDLATYIEGSHSNNGS